MCLIGWAAWHLGQRPELGASWSFQTGVVREVVPGTPASSRLQPGDRILSIDGIPVRGARPLAHKHAGESVNLIIEREGQRRSVAITLIAPSLNDYIYRYLPLFVALAFWGFGTVVLAFSPQGREGLLLFLFCQIGSAALASGVVSGYGPLWTAWLFALLLWWLGPLAVHFHLHFPFSAPPPDSRRLAILLYTLAAVGNLLDLVIPLTWQAGREALGMASRFWLAGSMLIVVLLLAQAYRRAASPEMRQKVGGVVLGGVVSLLPLLAFSLLPDALLRQPLLPYEFSFLFLLTIPLAYGYAILRHRLMQVDRFVSRGAASALVLTLLGGLYLAVNAALAHLLPSDLRQSPLVNLALVLLLAAAFAPLHRRLQIVVNYLFYGGWYDYRTAVQQVSQRLDQAGDSSALAQALSGAIQTAMQLECACLLLPDRKGGAMTASFACHSCLVPQAGPLHVDLHGPLGRYFQDRSEVVEADVLRKALEHERLSDAEAQLLNCKRARLWVPMPGRDQPPGLLLLGAKRGGEPFDRDDRTMLEVIARQASLAWQNTQLIAELQQQLREGERLHREIVRAREAERAHVARELHDRTIQMLIGLNHQLSELRRRDGADLDGAPARLQEEVRGILGDVRRIIGGLRSPVLDSLGLVPAVRSYLRELTSQHALQVRLQVDGDEEQDLPEEVALCLYRVLQEALTNVQKHAAARQVVVAVKLRPDEVTLSVEDDGRGFVLPPRLGLLMDDGHFGLFGLRERLEMVQGTLKVTSTPGRGTRLEARVPLTGIPL